MRFYRFFTILLLIILTSCGDDESFWIPIDKECIYDNDCKNEMRCLANICVSNNINDSETKFSIRIAPQNSSSMNYYYLPLKTDILTIEELENSKNEIFKVQTVPKTEIIGLITNSHNVKISYQISAQSEKNSSLIFTTRSYEEDGKTYYRFNIPIDSYKITVYPEKIYPPYSFTVVNLEASSIFNAPIQLDQSYFDSNGYKKIYGILEYYLGEQKNYLNDASIYAFTIDNNGKENLISNKTSSCNSEVDSNCKKNGYFSLLIPNNIKTLYLKITSATLPQTTFINNIELQSENIGTINIGNFIPYQDVSLSFSGDCGNLEGIKIDIMGIIGNNGVFRDTFYTTCKNCKKDSNSGITKIESDHHSLKLMSGKYFINAKTSSASCYSSASFEIDIDSFSKEFKFNLENKGEYKGVVLNHLDIRSPHSSIIFQKQNFLGLSSDTEVLTDSNGDFNVMLEEGIYNILIKSSEQQDNSATTTLFSQNFNKYSQTNLTFKLSEGYKTLLSLSDINLNPISSAVVSLYLENLPSFFNNSNQNSYLIEQTITDGNGFFSLKIPLLKEIK